MVELFFVSFNWRIVFCRDMVYGPLEVYLSVSWLKGWRFITGFVSIVVSGMGMIRDRSSTCHSRDLLVFMAVW